jgi:hypothetical protein
MVLLAATAWILIGSVGGGHPSQLPRGIHHMNPTIGAAAGRA